MKNRLSLALITALCVTSASAMQFQTLGYKSVAMGGAGVASSSGSVATYNNPALLAKAEYDVEISMGGGVSYQDHGAGASFQALDDSGFIDTMDKANGGVENLATLSDTDRENLVSGQSIILAMDGDAVQIAPQAYFAAQVGSFGVGVFGSSDVVATAHVDETHDKLYFTDGTDTYDIDGTVTPGTTLYENESMQYAIEDGDTHVQALGIALGEVPIAYGHKLELSGGNLMIGGALKYMQAVTYTEKLNIDNTDSSTTSSTKTEKTSTSCGVDLGLAYEPYFAKELTLAVVGKNLNTPEFTFADGAIVKIKPMVRVGVAYNIFESLEIAADADVTKNETFVSGLENQMVGGGLNWHPASWFALRGGAMKNLDANDQADLIYTAGLGFGLKWFQLDLSGQISNKTSTVGDTTLPQYAKVNLALISRW